MAQSFERPAIGNLFLEFVDWVIARKAEGRIARRIGILADLLSRVEQSLKDGAPLDSTTVTAALTTEDVRRSGLLGMFLAEQHLLTVTATERQKRSDAQRIGTALATLHGKRGEQLREYFSWLSACQPARALRTQRVYLRAAIAFTTEAGVDGLDELNEGHLARFLRAKPGHRASLSAFLSFLKTKNTSSLSLPPKKAKKSRTIQAAIPTIKRRLVLLSSATGNARRALIADVLSIAYGVPLEEVLRLRNDCVKLTDGLTYLQLGGDWLAVHPPLEGLVTELTDNQANVPRAPLFPGRLHGDTLSVSGARYYSARRSLGT